MAICLKRSDEDSVNVKVAHLPTCFRPFLKFGLLYSSFKHVIELIERKSHPVADDRRMFLVGLNTYRSIGFELITTKCVSSLFERFQVVTKLFIVVRSKYLKKRTVTFY